jgi:hypothetical protein
MEPLEARGHFSTTPYHLQLAEELVKNISPANNVYSYDTPTVTWAGLDGAKTYSNSSDCSSFDTVLLTQAYGFTARQFTQWTGYSSPQALDYYDAAVADKGFIGFSNVNTIAPGDDLFIKYIESDTSNDTGHVATIVAAPTLISVSATQKTYNLTVIDCSADPHSNDTRSGSESGVGEGTMRLYTDLAGNLTSYAWGTSTDSTIETPATRPAIFAEIADAPEPDSFNLLGAAVAFVFLSRRRERSRLDTVSL